MFDTQKRQMQRRINARYFPKAVEPFFSALLVVVSLFMAVMLFGAGSILGGILFSLVLIPAGFVLWEEFFRGDVDEDEDTSDSEIL